jgi:hypothetical protein
MLKIVKMPYAAQCEVFKDTENVKNDEDDEADKVFKD